MSSKRPKAYVVPQTGEPNQSRVDWHSQARENRRVSNQELMG